MIRYLPFTGKLENDENVLVELVYKDRIFQFVHLNDTKPTYESTMDEYEVPGIEEVVIKGAITLPSQAMPYKDIRELRRRIREFIHRYVDVEEKVLNILVYYVMLSWLFDRFLSLPYLRALADTGSGKTRLLEVVGSLMYRVLKTSGATTFSPVFRLIEKWRGSLVMDEMDMKDSSAMAEMVKFLNCRNKKDTPLLRSMKDKPDKQQVFNVYGPTLLATRHLFKDAALERRCLTIELEPTQNKDIPRTLPMEFYQEAEEIRNQLLYFRLRNYFKPISDLNRHADKIPDLEPAIQEVLLPMFEIIGNDREEVDKLIDLAGDYQSEFTKMRQLSEEGQVLRAYLLLKGDRPNGIIVAGDVAKKLNEEGIFRRDVGPKWVSSRLRALKIKTSKSRTGKGYPIFVDPGHLGRLRKRYGFTDEETMTKAKAEPGLFE